MSFQVFNPSFEKRVWAKRRQAALDALKPPKKRTLTIGEMLALSKIKKQKQARQRVSSGPPPDYPGRESVSAIIERVAVAHSVPVGAIIGPLRFAAPVRARQAAMVEIVQARPDLSLSQVGRAVGREHTSVINALRNAGIDHRSAEWQATREAA
jgi:chromosomal replication initiation ATPase DnaA